MESDVLTGVRSVLEMGWPAIVLIAWWIVWTKLNQRTEQYINDLREMAGLKASLRPVQTEDSATAPPATVKASRASRASYP